MLVTTGIRTKWFDEFLDYWLNVLNGRPLTVMDFHGLHFHYRKRTQYTEQITWNDVTDHLSNWQSPNNIRALFHYVSHCAKNPVSSKVLYRILKKGMTVVEFGCGIAPMYRTYRSYFNHIEVSWILSDIANSPFHYARHIYGKDSGVDFVCITEELFDDPLKQIECNCDLIIVREVFEHLHKPRFIVEYLVERLSKGGLLYFDYVTSDALGYDTPAGKEERIPTLNYLEDKMEIIYGNFKVSDESAWNLYREEEITEHD